MKKLFLFIIAFYLIDNAFSQTNLAKDSTFQLFLAVSKPKEIAKSEYGKGNAGSLFFPFLFLYKSFLSEHDVPDVCRFEPTCGSYSAIAIQKHGILKGFVMTFDRLQRCNNFHYHEQYEFKPTQNIYLDHP